MCIYFRQTIAIIDRRFAVLTGFGPAINPPEFDHFYIYTHMMAEKKSNFQYFGELNERGKTRVDESFHFFKLLHS